MPIFRPFPLPTFTAALALLLAPASALCQDFTVGDLEYYLFDSDREVYVTGLANASATHITIPSTVPYGGDRYPVTGISENAFSGCGGLAGVSIPNSVTSIGYDAFSDCASALYDTNSIPGVRLVDGWAVGTQSPSGDLDLTGIRGIGNEAFLSCVDLTGVTIPDSVTRIGEGTFYGCGGLARVSLPNSVKNIETYSFFGCSGLTNLTIPDSVTNIGTYAFCECKGLTSVTLPDSVTCIGDGAFCECRALESVSIPNGVTSIGLWAFGFCTSLTKVNIPASVTNIGTEAFANCGSMNGFSVASGNPAYQSVSGLLLTKDGKTLLYGVNGDVVIPDSVTVIGDYAFCGYSGLTSVSIPGGVTSIGDEAFGNCSGLTSLTIPDSVTCIETYAFNCCSGLASLSLPDSVKSIGEMAFSGCDGLTNVSIGAGVTNIGYDAFRVCRAMNAFSVASGNPAYQSVSGLLLTKDGKTLFYGVNGNVVIPDGVTSIGDGAFDSCRGLTGVSIPDSVTDIGSCAFKFCDGLTSVDIPDSVTCIGSQAFSGCGGLTNVTLGGSVASIGDDAFALCSELTRVDIPDSVSSIGAETFRGCEGLTSVDIPDSVTNIGSHAFADCRSLRSVTIGASVTSIGDRAFAWCNSLTGLTIPDSVTDIGDEAFYGCNDLATLSVPGAWEGTTMLDNVWGWEGKPEGCVVVYRVSDAFPPAQDAAGVAAALVGAADGRLEERIQSVAEYEAFRAWMADKKLNAEGVKRSKQAWISYALGAKGLFVNEPEIVLGEMAAVRPGAKEKGDGVALELTVTVRDGENEVEVDAAKVAALFEATSDPCDWKANIPVDAKPMESEYPSMKFQVQPTDGTVPKAFLRLAP